MTKPTLIDVIVACRTEGCSNSDIEIAVKMFAGGNVVCGVCGADITPAV